MVNGSSNVKFVEKLRCRGHFRLFRVVTNNVFESIEELFLGHELHFSLNLTDHIFKLVVNDQNFLAFFCVDEDLGTDRSS